MLPATRRCACNMSPVAPIRLFHYPCCHTYGQRNSITLLIAARCRAEGIALKSCLLRACPNGRRPDLGFGENWVRWFASIDLPRPSGGLHTHKGCWVRWSDRYPFSWRQLQLKGRLKRRNRLFLLLSSLTSVPTSPDSQLPARVLTMAQRNGSKTGVSPPTESQY